MRILAKKEIDLILMKELSAAEGTKILDEVQENQPDIYAAIYGEPSDIIAEENADMADLYLDLCFDIILIYRDAFGKPPKSSSRKNTVMNSLSLLNTELIAFLDDTKMDESFRMSLEKRFFNRMMGEGFQIEVMKYLENRVEEYVSSKPERSKAINLTYCLLLMFLRLMDDLYSKKK